MEIASRALTSRKTNDEVSQSVKCLDALALSPSIQCADELGGERSRVAAVDVGTRRDVRHRSRRKALPLRERSVDYYYYSS